MPIQSRPYESLDDLRQMQSIVSAAWNSDRRPLVPCTVGDLEWWVAGAGPGADLSNCVRIWTDDDQPVGWNKTNRAKEQAYNLSLLHGHGVLLLQIRENVSCPGHSPSSQQPLIAIENHPWRRKAERPAP